MGQGFACPTILSISVEGTQPKTNVVVPVVRMVVVAVRHTGVVLIVVPRAAAQRQPFDLRLEEPLRERKIPKVV
jgi:hypothetical protein